MPVRAAIIGLGNWGRVLVKAAAQLDSISVVAAVSRDPARHADFAAEYGLNVVTSIDEALEQNIDAVIVTSPHSRHFDDAMHVLRADKHVFIEKPVALHAQDVSELATMAQGRGLVLAAGHNRRFLPAVTEIRKLIADGSFGQLLHVEANMSGPTSDSYHGSWRSVRGESPMGGLAGAGIHVIDLMIDLLGPINRVFTFSARQAVKLDMEDTTVMMFGFEGGQAGTLSTLTVTPQVFRFQIMGTHLVAEFTNSPELKLVWRDGASETRSLPDEDGVGGELAAFAASVRGDVPAYPISPDEVVHGIEVFEAVAKSSASGAIVQIRTHVK